jgi:hypothetical protein
MYTAMIFENNLQPDLCCLDYRAVQRLGPDGPSSVGAIERLRGRQIDVSEHP